MTTYFRVDRINAYSEGDTITLTSPEDIPSDFIQVLNMLAPGGLSPHGLVYCTNPSALAADKSVAIDLSLELFRRSFFASKPSRYQSVFAWDNLEDAQAFREKLLPEFPNCVINEVSTASDNIHRGDMSILANNTTNLVYTDILRLYWSSFTFRDDPLWEYVLPLPVTVGRRVS